MPSTVKLAVFDCDGTLVDSQHAINSCMTDAFIHVGLQPPPISRVRRVVGLPLAPAWFALRYASASWCMRPSVGARSVAVEARLKSGADICARSTSTRLAARCVGVAAPKSSLRIAQSELEESSVLRVIVNAGAAGAKFGRLASIPSNPTRHVAHSQPINSSRPRASPRLPARRIRCSPARRRPPSPP